LFPFITSRQSNDSNKPFEVICAVYNGEVIHLPKNSMVYLTWRRDEIDGAANGVISMGLLHLVNWAV